MSCHFWAALKKAQAQFPDFFLLSFFFKSLNFSSYFHGWDHGVFTNTAYVWGTYSVACPRDFCELELQIKFKVTQMKEHPRILYIDKKKGCSLPLNICSHTSACKQQDIFKHRCFNLCSGMPISCQVLCKVCFIYFIVSLCQIVLSSRGRTNTKVLTALTNNAWWASWCHR